jgi:uncharacterized protein (TIGR03118 family)
LAPQIRPADGQPQVASWSGQWRPFVDRGLVGEEGNMRVVSASLLLFAAGVLPAACEGPDTGAEISTESADLRLRSPRVVDVVTQVNLVSDQPGKANVTDPNLVNAWGLAFNPAGGPFWVSSAERGLSQVYDDEGKLLLSVTIPPAKGADPETNPTGQVFNGRKRDFGGDVFIFVTENGTVAGWQPDFGTTAHLRVNSSRRDANYKGVALLQTKGSARLLAADFHNARIDIFDEHYRPVRHHGRFVDPDLPDGYAPFNIAVKGAFVFVTYAKQDAGNGFVDVFDADGDARLRLVSRGVLNSPWGMAFTKPADDFSVRMLVGNFGDGRINVFRLAFDDDFRMNAKLLGTLGTSPGHPVEIDGLWALAFEEEDELYFTAGPEDETHGLFGKLVFPEPAPEE